MKVYPYEKASSDYALERSIGLSNSPPLTVEFICMPYFETFSVLKKNYHV